MHLRFIDRGCNVVVSISIIPSSQTSPPFYTGISVIDGIDYVGSEIFVAIEKFCLESGYLLSPVCCFSISTLVLHPIPHFLLSSACTCTSSF